MPDAWVLGTLEGEELAAFVLLDIAIVVVLARIVGELFKKIRQPAVVGEIIAGIMLGPSLLGQFPGNPTEDVFPLEVRPFLAVVAALGLVIFMFIVGLELDTRLIRGKEKVAAVISVSSVILPFILGVSLLALALYDSHDVVNLLEGGTERVDKLPFALFIGASMSITAFPVLARILNERRMNRTEIGVLALACAAVDDILAWSMLAVVLAVVSAGSALDLPLILVESIAFVAFMFLVVKPQLEKLVPAYKKAGRLTPGILSVVVVGFLLSAFITSEIGIHLIFGAFIFGAIMPREGAAELTHEILIRLEQISVLILLPVFFIVTGLGVDITGLGSEGIWQLALILVVAVSGKFVGAFGGARSQGYGTREASAIGILMNTRGLTELVILNVGREFGVLDTSLFTMLVIMAVVTTIMTEPLLRLAYPDRLLERDIAAAERLDLDEGFRVLVAADELEHAAPLVGVGSALVGDERPGSLIISNFAPQRSVEVGSGTISGMAEAMEAGARLERVAEDRGVKASVRAQYSDDPGRDLLEQVDLVGPAFVVTSESDETSEQVRAENVHTVVTVDDPGSIPDQGTEVAALGADEPTVAEVAIRLAHVLGCPLRLVEGDGRRAAGRVCSDLAERLRGTGLDVSTVADVASDAPATSVLVVAADRSAAVTAGTVLRVASRATSEERLGELIDRLGAGSAPSAEV